MLDYFCTTSQGGRSRNEDSHAVFGFGRTIGFAVCDGLGGTRHGDEASKLVCDKLCAAFENGGDDIEERVDKALKEAESELRSLQERAGGGYKTTLASVVINGNGAYIAHCGDSRVYHFIDGRYAWRTRDHSLAQMMVLTGDIEPEGIRGCEDRSVLLHAVGSATETFDYESCERALNGAETDAFIICSDGFWQYVTGEEMASALRAELIRAGGPSAAVWLGSLLGKVKEQKDNDNYTAIAVLIDRRKPE